MISQVKQQVSMDEVKERLVSFAINRDDLKAFLELISGEQDLDLVAIEYESQILKIISVGWGASFFLADSLFKNEISEAFWSAVNELSVDLSRVVSTTIGKEIDYFNIVKERLEQYVTALSHVGDAADPVSVIGPEFAKICGNENNVHVLMLGNRVFSFTVAGVKEFISSVEIQNGKN